MRSTVAFGMTMRINTASPLALKDILLYVLAYLLWLVNIGVCIVAVIQFRSAVTILWIALGYDHWTLGLLGELIVLLGGLAACVYVVFLESYYRQSVRTETQGLKLIAIFRHKYKLRLKAACGYG